MQYTLERLYELFKDAPDLGSLINPASVSPRDQLFTTSYEEVAPALGEALATGGDDPVAAVFGAAAEGVERAGKLLARQYTLVATNPPYLRRGKQGETLQAFGKLRYPLGKGDLATMFIERCREYSVNSAAYAMVTPQNWLFLGSYKLIREELLAHQIMNHVTRMGAGAFETISGEVVNVVLVIFSNDAPRVGHLITSLDASEEPIASAKASVLRLGVLDSVEQESQLANPDARITLRQPSASALLEQYVAVHTGLQTGDNLCYLRKFWELPRLTRRWEFLQRTVESSTPYGGREQIILWDDGQGALLDEPQSVLRGLSARGKRGVAVHRMGSLPCTLFTGELIDQNAAVIIPRDVGDLAAIWTFCQSPDYNTAVRRLDKKLGVTPATLTKVPFDLEHWQKLAEEQCPDGLPEPHSDDPTQWLFEGNVVGSESPLQVAVARLLGYRWPDQSADDLDALADADGIVCVPALAREKDGAERVRAFLAAAYRDAWSPNTLDQLLTDVGYSGKSLEQWLRDGFFEQHSKLFHHRPFIWQVWDGRRDGFSALVNYHRLDGARLQKLAYTYLGSWMERQRDEVSRGVAGAEDRLAAAQSLQEKIALLLKGEPPYDIYVRWKELHEQSIGWEPDLDDGVRLNIRPFMTAGVLRWKPNITWGKDRGKNPDGSERLNDLHYSVAEKQEARRKAGVVV